MAVDPNRLSRTTTANTIEMMANYVSNEGPTAVQNIRLDARFETREQAEAAAALFPKACRIKVYALGTYTGLGTPDYRTFTLYTIHTDIRLNADRVNGGKNETGIKRYRSIMRAAERAGLAVEWLSFSGNSYATQADFEAAL